MVSVFTGLGAGFERGSGAALGGSGFLGSASLGRAGEGVFLNAATGNLLLQRQDEFLVGRGPDVAIARTYNSLGNVAHDDNGDLWRQSTDRRIYGLTGTVNTTGSTVKRLSADGSEITYAWNGSYYATTDGAGAHDKLTYNAGVWTWTDGSTQIKETYGVVGAYGRTQGDSYYIAKQTDLDANSVTFSYVNGKLTRVATANDATGQQSAIEYGWTGNNLTSVVTKYTDYFVTPSVERTLARTTYAYDALNRLSSILIDETPENTADNATYPETLHSVSYTYDGASNRIASITQTDGSSLAIAYDTSGRVNRLVQTIGDGDTRTTDFAYDDVARRTDIKVHMQEYTGGATPTVTTSLYFDAANRLVKVVTPPANVGATAQQVEYVYDTAGNVTQTLETLSATLKRQTDFVIDARGNITRTTLTLKTFANSVWTDSVDQVIDRAYDANNNLTLETRTGSTGSSASAALHTRYVYDDENHLRYVISAEGRVSEYRYTPTGEVSFAVEYPQHWFVTGSAPQSEAQMNAWRDGLTDRSSVKITTYIYDARGAVWEVYRHDGAAVTGTAGIGGYHTQHYRYDQAGRLVWRYDGRNSSWENFAYDGLDRQIGSSDAYGGVTSVVFTDGQSMTTITTSTNYTTVSRYNKAGELISFVDSGANTTGGTTTYAYDKQGRVRVVTREAHKGVELRQDKSYVLYDKLGRKTADISHDGQVTEYRYDQAGRLVASVRYTNKLTAAQVADLNNLALDLEFGSVSFPRPTPHGYDIWQWTVYDAAGRAAQTIQGDGAVVAYAYDAGGRLVKTTSHANKLTQATINALIAAPPSSPVAVTTNTGDVVVRTFYDADGLLIGTLNGEGYLSEVGYDGAGQRVREIAYANATAQGDRANGTFALLKAGLANSTKDVSTRRVYDGQGLLRFTIDALGRVTEQVYWSDTDYAATGLVRKVVQYATPLGNVSDYTYATIKTAVAGLASPASDRTSYNAYDEHGRLAYAVDSEGAVTAFAYDAAGRVTKTIQYAVLVNMSAQGTDLQWKVNLDAWAALNSASARVTRNYYAERGDLLYQIDAEGYITQNDYEAQGRLYTQYRYANAVQATDAWTVNTILSANKGAAVWTSYRYDALGHVQDVYDASGTRHYSGYLANGQKVWEIVAFGQGADEATALLEYDQAGKLIRRTEGYGQPEAAVTQYAYDGLGNLSSITDPRGVVTSFVYDKVGRMVSRTDASGTSLARTTTLAYDAFGRGVKTTDAKGNSSYAYFDQLGRVTLSVDAEGYVTKTDYTPFSEVGAVKRYVNKATGAWNVSAPPVENAPSGPAIATNAADATSVFVYDKLGRLKSTTNAEGGITQHQLNAFGEVVKTTDARGNPSHFYYDELGRIELAIDAEGYATETTYTTQNKIETVTRRANVTTGASATARPAVTPNLSLDATTVFAYDAAGRLISQTNALNAVTSYIYDRRDNVVRVTNALGGVVERKYDDLDRLVEETTWFGDFGVAGSAKSVTKFDYDAASNLTQKIEAFGQPEQRTTIYGYDELNRLKTITHDAIAAANSATGATTNRVEEFFYDAASNLIEKRDAMGARTAYWYDALGRLEYELIASETVSSDQKGTFTRNIYDANGNIVERRIFADLVTLPPSVGGALPDEPSAYRQTLYGYDKLNRVKTVSMPGVRGAVYANGTLTVDPASEATIVTTYDYDANGNVIRVTDAKGAQTYSYFDKLGRKTAQIDAGLYRTDWGYDANGNVLSETRFATAHASAPATPGGSPPTAPVGTADDRITNFSYDKMGRRLTETRTGVLVHNGAGAHTSVSAVITYAYNALGAVVSKLESSGEKIAYGYDLGGRLTSEQRTLNNQSYLYVDAFGANVAPTVEYAYNGLNDLTQTKAVGNANAQERVTLYTYGAGGLLVSKTDAEGFIRSYIYDAAGRVVREQYIRVKADGASAEEAVGYDYDLAGRVTAQGLMVKDNGVYTRSKSNALGESIDTAVMRYNAYGEVAERGINGVYAEKFEYDAAGRLTRTNSGDGAWKYFMYDGAGNQTLVIESVGTDLNAAATDTLDEVLALWTGGTATVATANVTGVVATITRYDARNQAVEVREPQRELTTTGSLVDLKTSRMYNAFGDVIRETNALGHDASGAAIASASVEYAYNTMGRVIQVTSPAVSITGENGVVTNNYRPVEHRYYDASGRLVASRDGNGNLTKTTLLAGSGYNGSQALVTEVINADGGVVRTKFNIHGDAVRIEDQLYNAATSATAHLTTQSFDRMGRLVSMNRSNILTDYYAYDELGQRIKHWNSFYNANGQAVNEVEKTFYDQQGRVTQVVAMGGDATTYTYGWNAGLVTAGMGNFGGWSQTTTYANNKAILENIDLFGRAIGKADMSGHITNFTYDKAGRLTQRSGVYNNAAFGETLYQTYFNTGKLKEIYQTTGERPWGPPSLSAIEYFGYRGTAFGYDAIGNVASQLLREMGALEYTIEGHYDGEGYWVDPEFVSESFDRIVSSQTAAFDALGRIVSWNELGGTASPIASHVFQYDANGNIRRSLASYRALDSQGVASTTTTPQDYWYRYDAMDRMTTSKGQLVSGAVARGTTGVDTVYDAAGNRRYTITAGGTTRREDYTYDALNRVTQVKSGTNLSSAGSLASDFTYDALGRLTLQKDYGATEFVNGNIVYSRTVTYNAKNQVTADTTDVRRGSGAGTKLYRAISSYNYGSGASYALGAPLTITTENWETGGVLFQLQQKDTSSITNTYAWWDGAVQNTSVYDKNVATTDTNGTSTFVYDVIGGAAQLARVQIVDGRSRTVTFTNDMFGQVIRRDEKDGLSGGDPHEVWYRYSGRQMGYVGNNGTIDTTYQASVSDRTASQGSGAFHNGSTSSTSFADFDLAYDAINSYEQGSRGGMYTVQAGDTLSGIAAALWGDANLWYKIAEVNGLTSETALVEGQPLIIPVGVVRSENNATTFQPYDPLEVIGNTSPTAPKPPKGKKCGGLGQVLLAVIAVVVVAIIAPGLAGGFGSVLNGGTFGAGFSAGMGASSIGTAAAIGAKVGVLASGGTAIAGGSIAAAAFAGGAAAGALGSIVSQGVGVMTGIQEKFSWNAVALAAIGGGLNGAMGAGAKLGVGGSSLGSTMLRQAAANAITQGIGVATGLQKDFSWAGVAAAGVGAAAFQFASNRLPGAAHAVKVNGKAVQVGANLGNRFGSSMASMVANAATRSLIDGSGFGDNVLAALPDVIGQTIGEAIAGSMTGRGAGTTGAPNTSKAPQTAAQVKAAVCDVPATEPVTPQNLTPEELEQLGQAGLGAERIGAIDATLGAQAAADLTSPSAALSNSRRSALLRLIAGNDDAYDAITDHLNVKLRNALIDSDPEVVGVRQQIEGAQLTNEGTTLRGLSLDARQYAFAVHLGIWGRVRGDLGVNAISNNNQVGAAAAGVDDHAPLSTNDVQASQALRRFVFEIASLTDNARLMEPNGVPNPQGFEKVVAVENSAGGFVVTTIRGGGRNGSRIQSLINSNTAATLHTHYAGLNHDVPNSGDHSLIWNRDKPTFVYGGQQGRLYELFRQNQAFRYGRVNEQGNLLNVQTYQMPDD